MPKNKTCPLKLFLSSINEKSCNKSGCELWSAALSRCSIIIGMNSLLEIAGAVRGFSSEIIKK